MFAGFFMISLKKLGMRSQVRNLRNYIASKSNKVFYAVGRGKETGVYECWNDCWLQINKFSNAKFRKFNNSQEAEEFVNFWKKHSALINESSKIENKVVPAEKNIEKVFKYEKPSEIQYTATKQTKMTPQPLPSFSSDLQVLSPDSISYSQKAHLNNSDSSESNLTLDTFKTVFDVYFKEMRAISSAVSSLKLDIKKLKDSLDCNLLSKSNESIERNEDLQEISSLKSWSIKQEKVINSENPEEQQLKKLKASAETNVVSLENETSVKKVKVVSSRAKVKKDETNSSLFLYDKDGYVTVFTDGSVVPRKNGEKGNTGGVGVWFGENNPFNLSMPIDGYPTNNLAEIQAARMALEVAVKAGIKQLKIMTDSSFVINCATKWIFLWKKKNWTSSTGRPIKHKDELEKLSVLATKIKVKWEKVPGHAGIKGNESADRLANNGSLDMKLLGSSAVNSAKKTAPYI